MSSNGKQEAIILALSTEPSFSTTNSTITVPEIRFLIAYFGYWTTFDNVWPKASIPPGNSGIVSEKWYMVSSENLGPLSYSSSICSKGAVYTPESAVVDGQLITGRGAGHAVNFGLAILGALKGDETVARVKAGLML